jgi:hypothetical protein
VAAESPHRVAHALVARCTGVSLSSCGGQGIIDSTADDLRTWQAEHESGEAEAVGEALDDKGAELRGEVARDGGMAHIDGRWQAAKVGTMRVRQLAAQAEDLALHITQAMRAACWARSTSRLADSKTNAIELLPKKL